MKNITYYSWSSLIEKLIKYTFLSSLLIIFLVELALHLRFQITTDGAFLHYVAYLVNEHYFIPYRDIFEPNMPGTYLFHMSIGQLLGYSNLAYYFVSAIWIMLILIVTWVFMKTISKTVALAACLFFGLIYLQIAPNYMALQRDFVLILPISFAILLSISYRPTYIIHFLIGLLFAIAALFKPHAAIGLPVIILFSLIYDKDKVLIKEIIKPFIVGCLFASLGFFVTFSLSFLWLWKIDAITAFWEILSLYAPLYAQMSGNFEFQEGFNKVLYILNLYIGFGGFGLLFITSIFGLGLILRYSAATKTKKLAILLLVMTFLYSLYAAIGGKLWLYHWMPFTYFVSLSAAMLFFSPDEQKYQQFPYPKTLPPLIFVGIIMMYLPITQVEDIKRKFTDLPKLHEQISLHNQDAHFFSSPTSNEIITEITQYLNTHLEPNDTVQPLGWISGITQAMLFSRAELATPYINDFQFYHHVSHPYIQQLRADFITRLQRKKPKFIIRVQEGAPFKPKMLGTDVSYEFPELFQFIKTNYVESYVGNGFVIFRRNVQAHQETI